MGGQSVKTDVKVGADGSVSGGIDLGNGQKLDVSASAGPGGASAFGGFSLAEFDLAEGDSSSNTLSLVVSLLIVLSMLAGGAFVLAKKAKKQKDESFRKVSQKEELMKTLENVRVEEGV